MTTLRATPIAAASLAMLGIGAPSSIAAGGFAVAPAAGGANIQCSVPNNVKCTITSAKGVKSVRITSNTPFGNVDLVNTSYNACPKQVTVSWDSAYQAASTNIVECGTAKLLLRQ
jgi:hypothetical protein